MTTVLFVHGLESGPHGRKVRVLTEAGFDVVAVRMPCSRPYVVRDPVVIGAAAAAALVAALAWTAAGPIGLAVVIAAGLLGWPVAKAALATRVFRRSVAVQQDALERHRGRIDVVVGSSFGGAVTVELLRSGAWAGPTVLLCPAHVLVAHRGRRPPPSLRSLPAELRERIVVVHGKADDIVPVAHSEALVDGTDARLILVDDDHRLTATATAANLAAWIAATGAAAPSAR